MFRLAVWSQVALPCCRWAFAMVAGYRASQDHTGLYRLARQHLNPALQVQEHVVRLIRPSKRLIFVNTPSRYEHWAVEVMASK